MNNVNLEKLYDILLRIQQKAINYSETKQNDFRFRIEINQYGINGSGFDNKIDLTEEEIQLLCYLLNYHLGANNASKFPGEHKMVVNNPEKLIVNSILSDYRLFEEFVSKNKEIVNEQCLAVLRHLAAINNRDRSALFFSFDSSGIHINGDGIEIRDPYFHRVCEEILINYGVEKTDDVYQINDAKKFWEGTCLDENYNMNDILSRIAENGQNNSTFRISDFSIGGILFVNGLSQTLKNEIKDFFVQKYNGEITHEINGDYVLFVPNVKEFIDDMTKEQKNSL